MFVVSYSIGGQLFVPFWRSFVILSLFEIVVGIVWFGVLMYLFARVIILFSCADIDVLQSFFYVYQ